MITAYNKYINRDTDVEIVKEKIDFSIKNLLDLAKSKMEEIKRSITYNSVTADNQSVKVGGTYYAVFQQIDSDPTFYIIVKLKITSREDKMIKGTDGKDKKFYFFTFSTNPKEISLEGALQGTTIADYKLTTSDKAVKKLSDNQITGYYLYEQEKVGKDIKDIIKRYGVVEKEGKTGKDIELTPGNIYEITNSKGNRIKLLVYTVEDGKVTGYDLENKQKYPDFKLQNIKDPELVTSLYHNKSETLKKLDYETIKASKEYQDLETKKEKIDFLSNIQGELQTEKEKTNKYGESESMTKLKNYINQLSKKIVEVIDSLTNKSQEEKEAKEKEENAKKEASKGKQQTLDFGNDTDKGETLGSNASNPEEQAQVDDLQSSEEKAQKEKNQPKTPQPKTPQAQIKK